jgi:type II secretory pathway pseudopilin PulG
MRKQKKRPLTLLEIMIVIFLIGLIGSVVGYNMKGSLDKGRAFKTERAQEQVRDILLLEVAQGEFTLEEAIGNPEAALQHSGMVKDAKKMLQDGWGQTFKLEKRGENDLVVLSDKLDKYEDSQKRKGKKIAQQNPGSPGG